MIVYLLRHGIAEDFPSAGGGDAERALTAEGRTRLERATDFWRRLAGPIDLVLSSPLRRARQTAEIFQRAVAADAPLECDPALEPSARPLRMLEHLQPLAAAGRRGVACVGHEPHLGCLLGLLLTGSDRASIPFKKGMLAVVEIDGSAHMIGRLIGAVSQKLAGGS